MLPTPLHPALVHFPIVLSFLLPVVALGTLWAIRRGATPRATWLLTVLTAAALTASSWVAVETGEGEADRVERQVGEQALERHEEGAERFLALSGGVLVLSAAGLLNGRPGKYARTVGLVAALGLMAAIYQVGHSGGSLVYGTPGAAGIGRIVAEPGATGESTAARAPRASGQASDD